MGSPTIMEFPDSKVYKDPDRANYQNYLAWQAEIAQRRRHSQTQFNKYQCRHLERMSDQVLYKEEADRDSENLKQMIERRLSRACDCDTCDSFTRKESRSNSDASDSSRAESKSPAGSGRSSVSSLSATSPPGTTVKGPTGPSSKNSLIVSPPPRSRHHHRRRARTLPE